MLEDREIQRIHYKTIVKASKVCMFRSYKKPSELVVVVQATSSVNSEQIRKNLPNEEFQYIVSIYMIDVTQNNSDYIHGKSTNQISTIFDTNDPNVKNEL